MRKQFGLSLVELMISVALGLILLTGVLKIFISSKVVFSTQQGLSRVQETGRLALDFMSRDIRMAAYYGCNRPSSNNKLEVHAPKFGGLHNDYGVGIIGYDTTSALPDGATADLGATITPITSDPKIMAHIIVIRGATQVGNILTAPNTANGLVTYSDIGPDTSGCVGGLCPGSIAIAADCANGYIFPVSTLSWGGAQLTVNHTDSWGGSTNIKENFGAGAELLPINTTVYFLAKSKNNPKSVSSLWQKTNNGESLELLEGVEQMNITYSRFDVPAYVTGAVINTPDKWNNVQSVRIEIVVRSLDNNVTGEPQPYTFNNKLVTPDNNDHAMRQVFSTTVAIRSRMILK